MHSARAEDRKDGSARPGQTVAVVAGLPDHLIHFRGELIRRMVEKGHRVVAWAAESDGLSGAFEADVALRLREMGVELRPLALKRAQISPLADLKVIQQPAQEFREIQPDLVFSFHTKPVILGSLAARLVGRPRCCPMITGLGFGMTGGTRRSLKYRAMKVLYRLALGGSPRVIFQNPDNLQAFREEGILKRDQEAVLVNGSGVDLAYFSPEPMPPGPPGFLMTARLLASKGVREYAGAAAILRRQWPEVKCVLLGPLDRHTDSISEGEVERWSREGILDYQGSAQDVRPFLRACQVFVLPSYGEGTPRTVLEAMAGGRAVITTDVPGCRQTIEPGRSGLLVPPRDPLALAAAMEAFLLDQSLSARMGREARGS